jgi:hypothetical protein
MLNPRLKNLIKVNQQVYILNLIFLHFLPGLLLVCHAANPKVEAGVLNLLTYA